MRAHLRSPVRKPVGWTAAVFGVWLACLASCGGGGPGESSVATEAGHKSALAAGGSRAEETVQSIYTEAGKLIRGDESAVALGNDLMGDRVNLYNGSLEFVQTDVSLPGNSALPVSVGRRLVPTPGMLANGHFGEWDLEVPRVHGVFSVSRGWTVEARRTDPNPSRCQKFGPPPQALGIGNQGTFNADEYWHGSFLYVPGAGSQEILVRNIAGANASDRPHSLTTKSQWAITCVPLRNGLGDGFLAVAPDGTQYRFDWYANRDYAPLSKPSPDPVRTNSTNQPASDTVSTAPQRLPAGYILKRQEIWIMATEVIDRYGNKVAYNYNDAANPWRLTSIESVEAPGSSRLLSFEYVAGSNRIASVFDGTRRWTYGYRNTSIGFVLSTVTLPDLSSWLFALDPMIQGGVVSLSFGGGSCDSPFSLNTGSRTGTITHPSGAVGSFTIAGTRHGRSYVERECRGNAADGDWSFFPLYIDTFSIQQKVLTDPGVSAHTWNYGYGQDNASFATSCAGGCIDRKTVTVTDESRQARTTYTFGNRFRVNEGQLLQVDEGPKNQAVLRVTTHSYRAPAGGAYPDPVGYSSQLRGNGELASRHAPQDKRVVYQQGVEFSWEVDAGPSGFDRFARPLAVRRSSTLGYSRRDVTVYADALPQYANHLTLWVLGQVASTTETTTGLVVENHTYNPTSANRELSYSFGRLVQRTTFNSDGTLASRADAVNPPTLFSEYKRGLAQRVQYPDNTVERAVVNDIGLITSVTNAANTTTGYGYDPIGRLNLIVPPGGDPVPYNNTGLTFSKMTSAEAGLSAGHWKQTVTTGNALTERFFDAQWRPLLTRTLDTANPAGTAREVLSRYDSEGRKTFQSYPQRSIGSVNAAPKGTTTTYDVLGRVTVQRQDSEFDSIAPFTPIQTLTAYGAGFVRSITNPRGYTSTTGFQAFDAPSESAMAWMTAPDSANTSVNVGIGRDVFGKPKTITRSGVYGRAAISVTRGYTYDGNQRLCKTTEPETGATVQDYDAASNLLWRASGLVSSQQANDCQQGSVPPLQKISYGYDARRRLTTTQYGDGSPSITRTYTPDGLPQTVATSATGVASPSIWTYSYYNRRLLKQERLDFEGIAQAVQWGVNANGHTSQLTYPHGSVLEHAPNALGEPTALTSGGTPLATQISYHPNGAVAGYTLGNGIKHTMTQNLRQLPEVWKDMRTDGARVMDDRYTYDRNANVTAIADLQQSNASRAMGYDPLDRLTQANGVWGTGGFTYDPLDNMRTSGIGARNFVHEYQAANRLTRVFTGTDYVGLNYDDNGNITARGVDRFAFDIGNRMKTAAIGSQSFAYTYDGHGRRIKMGYVSTGAVRTQFYSQGGKLLEGRHKLGMGGEGTTAYVYLGSKLIADFNIATGTAPSVLTFIHADALGSPVARSKDTQEVFNRVFYEPYGRVVDGVNSAQPKDIGFTAHVNDAEAGLVYMQQRYYEPYAGRFLSVDPVTTDWRSGAGFGRYHYAANNPFRFTDPDGRSENACLNNPGASCESFTFDDGNAADNSPEARHEAGLARSAAGSGPDCDELCDDIVVSQVLPPTIFFLSEPPVIVRPALPIPPRNMVPLEELPAGSTSGPGAGKAFPRSLNKDQPEGVPCTYCRGPTSKNPGPSQLNGDHVQPMNPRAPAGAAGAPRGNNSKDNYTPSCRDCNLRKRNRNPTKWYRDEGWALWLIQNEKIES